MKQFNLEEYLKDPNKIIMNDKLKELIQPYWVEEQQGVYIPLIDKVLLSLCGLEELADNFKI